MEHLDKEQQQMVFTFTDYLSRVKKAEMDLLHKFRFQFPQLKPGITDVERTSDISIEKKKKTLIPCDEDSTNVPLPKNCKIDDRALVVNGRLVYLQKGGEGVSRDRRQLLQQLKANKIGLREYALGKKEKFHRQIKETHMLQEKEIIDGYIRKHINVEKTAKIEFSDNFESTKQQLFCGK